MEFVVAVVPRCESGVTPLFLTQVEESGLFAAFRRAAFLECENFITRILPGSQGRMSNPAASAS